MSTTSFGIYVSACNIIARGGIAGLFFKGSKFIGLAIKELLYIPT